MSKRPSIGTVRAGDVRSDRPIYQPLRDALATNQLGEERIITAGDLKIAPKFRGRPEIVDALVRDFEWTLRMNQEFMHEVLVMERSDGSLWVYDDCHFVEAAQRTDPTMALPCFVFRDPTK